MGQMEKDVAQILVHVEYIREANDKRDKDYVVLEQRVDEIERKDIKRSAWATGATWLAGVLGGAFGFAASHWESIAKALALLCAMFALGCAKVPDTLPPAHWLYIRPVRVAIDENMPTDCLEAAEDGAHWWDVDYLEFEHRPHTWVGFLVTPRGYITIQAGQLSPDTAGETIRHMSGHEMVDAEVWLDIDNCKNHVAARHEMGHALGLAGEGGYGALGHSDDPENIMFRYANGRFVTPEQMDWLR